MHAAVGKPQAPGRRSVARFPAAAKRAAARAGVHLIFHAYHLDDKCIDVAPFAQRSHSRATSSISPSRTKVEIACENSRIAHKAGMPDANRYGFWLAVMPYGEWHARNSTFSLSVSASRRPRPATTEADGCETGG